MTTTMKQILVKEPFHCPFFDEACHKKDCPSYTSMRSYTRDELQAYWSQDIPVFGGGVADWCTKYNRCVAERKIIKEVPVEH